MMLFSLLALLFGLYVIINLSRREISLRKSKEILEEREEKKKAKKEKPSIDYKLIIVSNSFILSFLTRLDANVALKLKIVAATVVLLFVANMLLGLGLDVESMAVIAVLIFISFTLLPAILVQPYVRSHYKKMLESLPYFIDLMAVSVQSGLTVDNAIRFVAERFSGLDPNMASVMLRLLKKSEVSGLEEGLNDLYHAMDAPEMRMFSSTLQQSVHFGSSLYEQLLDLSGDIRELQVLATEERIGKLSAKMSVPLILLIMFPIVILIVAPGLMRMMSNV